LLDISIVRPLKNLNCSPDLNMPLSGMVCHQVLALATINPTTKFEVPVSTHYEDMKGDTKCRNGVAWGSQVTQGHWK